MKKSDTQELKKLAGALAKQEANVKAMQKSIVRLERALKKANIAKEKKGSSR